MSGCGSSIPAARAVAGRTGRLGTGPTNYQGAEPWAERFLIDPRGLRAAQGGDSENIE